MNKALIVIIVVIAAYLGYNSLSNEEGTTSENISSNKSLGNQEAIKDTAIPEEVYNNESTTLDGRYILNITTDLAESSQVFAFSSNGSFELSRSMISPNPALAGSIEGTYFIKGNTVHLVFPVDRDKKTFPVDTAEMTVMSETELKYGHFIARRD